MVLILIMALFVLDYCTEHQCLSEADKDVVTN